MMTGQFVGPKLDMQRTRSKSISRTAAALFILLSALQTMAVADEQANNGESQDSYQRVISAGGSITEVIHALGVISKVIAVDTSSMYPPSVSSLPQVGYFRNLGAEGLLSLAPDLLVAARGAGPDSVLTQVQRAGVTVKQFEQSVYTLESWSQLIQEMGVFFGKSSKATELIETALKNIELTRSNRRYNENSLNAIALLNSGQRGPTIAGTNTVPDLLLSLAGLNNLAGELEGYKPFSSEMLASNTIDVILVPQHNLESMGGIEGVCANVAIKYATVQGCNVHVMDPLLMLGFGARIDQAVTQVSGFANRLQDQR